MTVLKQYIDIVCYSSAGGTIFSHILNNVILYDYNFYCYC